MANDQKIRLSKAAWWVLGLLMTALALATIQKMVLGRDGDLHSFFYQASRVLLDGTWRLQDSDSIAFTVLPIALLPMICLSLVPYLIAAVVWAVASTAFLVFAVVLSTKVATSRVTGITDAALVPIASLVGIGLITQSVLADLNLGQIDLLIVALISLAIYWLYRRPVACGVCLAIAASYKFVGLLFVPWLIIRRAWIQAASTLAAFTALWAITIPWLGIERSSWRLTNAFVGSGRLNLSRSEPLSVGEGRSLIAGIQRMFGSYDPALVPWATGGTLVSIAFAGWLLYRLTRQPLFTRKLGQSQSLDLLEAVCLPLLAIICLPAAHIRHGCMALMATCLLASLLLTPDKKSRALAMLAVMVTLVASQAHLADVIGLDYQWDYVGGFGWTMLLLLLTLIWVVLGRVNNSTNEATEMSKSSA